MDLRYSQANECFHAASEILVAHRGGVHERLSLAVSQHLERAFAGGPLPDPGLERRREAIAQWFTGVPLSYAIDALSHDEASQLAADIVSLANDIRVAHDGPAKT